MESFIIPDSLKSFSSEFIAQCFEQNINKRPQNLKVTDPKSIFGKVATELTKQKVSTLEERKYLNLLWTHSIKVTYFFNQTKTSLDLLIT